MAPAWLRYQAASRASSAFAAGAEHNAAARSSAAERGPASQALCCPPSTIARISLAAASSGAALTTLADSALSPSSFHHSGLATSAHSSSVSTVKAHAVARPHSIKPTRQRSLASRNRCAASTQCPELLSAAPRLKYAAGLSGLSAIASRRALADLRQSSLEAYRAASASSSPYASPDCAASRAATSAVSRFRCCVTPPSSLPGARVPRAVDAAPVRRRHLQLDANRASIVPSPGRRPCLTAAWRSRSKRGSAAATRSAARRPRPQRVARRQAARWQRVALRQRAAAQWRPPWPHSRPSVPSAPRGPPCCPLPGLAAARAAWRAAAWGRARDPRATARGRPPGGRRPCDASPTPSFGGGACSKFSEY
eukprot:scaffold9959_cov66-Phaeocystis_antarctica.AAC.1